MSKRSSKFKRRRSQLDRKIVRAAALSKDGLARCELPLVDRWSRPRRIHGCNGRVLFDVDRNNTWTSLGELSPRGLKMLLRARWSPNVVASPLELLARLA